MITRLILIRHGITDWNRQKRYCGRKDISLSSEGKIQAAKLRRRLRSVSFDRVYSSDRKRAMQTARIIFKGFKITRIKGLKELNFGMLEGLTHEEIMKRHALIYQKWLRDPFRNHIPGAEAMGVFKKRVNAAIKKIARFHPGETIAIVCHAGTIAIYVYSILKGRNFWRYVPSAGTITVVEYKNGKPKIKHRDGSQVEAELSPGKGQFKIGSRTVPKKE